MFVRARSRITDRLMASGIFAVVLMSAGCDPELIDLLHQYPGTGGGSAGQDGGMGAHGGIGGGAGSPDGGIGGGGGAVVDGACAFTLCPAGTICQDRGGATAICVKVPPPPPQCGPTCAIKCDFGHVLDANGCPTCRCNPPPSPNPCATVRCATGTHCEAKQVQCVVAPCPSVAQCVPDAPVARCGGVANLACPGAGTCLENTDICVSAGAAASECPGICECRVRASCLPGSKFDGSPTVCACVQADPVPPVPPTCGPVCLIFCEYGNALDGKGCPTCACNPPPKGTACAAQSCMGQPNYLCPDGLTMSGPRCLATGTGSCAWVSSFCQ